MEEKEKLISNTTYAFLNSIAGSILAFIYWIIVSKTLLPEDFGIIATSTTLMSFISMVLPLGVNYAASKLIPEYIEDKKKSKAYSLIRFSFKLILVTNIISIAILYTFSQQISTSIKITSNAFYLTLLGILFSSLYVMTSGIYVGLQNFRKMFTSDVLGNTSKVGASILLILIGFSFYGPIIGFILSFLISFFLRIDKNWIFKKHYVKIDKKQIMLKYSMPILIFSLATFAFTSMQYIILPLMTDQYETGLFSTANKVTFFIYIIPSTLGVALLPVVSGLSAQKFKKQMQSKIIKSSLRYSLIFTLPIVFFSIIFSNAIILVFATPKYLDASPLFTPMALAFLFFGLASILINGLYAIRKPEYTRKVSTITAIIFIFISVLLTYYLKSLGMALATLTSMFVIFILSYFHLNRFLKINFHTKELLKIGIANLYILISFIAINMFNTILTIKLTLAILSSVSYLFVYLPLKFYTKNDRDIFLYFSHKLPITRKYINILVKIVEKYG